MKWVFVAAIVNACIVLLWILAFAGTIGTPHELFYFWLPAAFLIVPLLIIAAYRFTPLGRPENEAWGGIGCSALILNFIVFLGYLMVSGGGM